MTPAFPKPTRAPRAPKPLKRKAQLRAKRWGVSRSDRGTAHSRRARERGYMSWCRNRGCELALDHETQAILGIEHLNCPGPVEFAHLHDRRRYAEGDVGAGLCRGVHRSIDGRIGGKATWYASLGKYGQHLIRMHLANRARRAWDALPEWERARWDRAVAQEGER